MHLRRLIVLIINARNIINPSRLLSSWIGLRRRDDLPMHHCIGFDRSDQKKPFFTHNHCSFPRVSGQTDSDVSLHDVQRSGHGRLAASNATKLALIQHTDISKWAIQGSIQARHSSVALMAFLLQILPPEGFALRDSSKWWSQTGSNRRHPACKAGALPAELWPHQGCHQPKRVVGPGRLELPTSRLSGVRSNHLSYGPQASAWTGTC